MKSDDHMARMGVEAMTVYVIGTPAPQGSMKAYVVAGRAAITSDNKKMKPWRQDVTAAVVNTLAQMPNFQPYTGPVRVDIVYYLPRIRAHFRTGKRANELRPGAPTHHTVKPDKDKLDRAILDALTASNVFRDDSQVAAGYSEKRFANAATGARITVTPITPQSADAPTPSPHAGVSARPDGPTEVPPAVVDRPAAPPMRPDPDIMDNAEGITRDLAQARAAARAELAASDRPATPPPMSTAQRRILKGWS